MDPGGSTRADCRALHDIDLASRRREEGRQLQVRDEERTAGVDQGLEFFGFAVANCNLERKGEGKELEFNAVIKYNTEMDKTAGTP